MKAPNQFRYDPDVGFTFVPNLQLRIPHESGGYLIKTNALGFRDARTPVAEGGRRVFVFGDSFTAGDGVSNGKRFSDRLEQLVPGVAFYNFGLPGTGTDQQLIAFRKFAAALRCDLVIVAVLVENIRRITAQFRPAQTADGEVLLRPKPYFELHNGKLVRFHDPVPEGTVSPDELDDARAQSAIDRGGRYPALRKLVKSLGAKDLVQRLTAYQPVPDFDSPSSPAWQLLRALLVAWREASRSPLLVVPLPLYQHVEETADARAYQQRFNELSAQTGIAVHDVLPDLRRYSADERRRFRFAADVHLTPLGHEAVARSLAPAVAAMLDGAPAQRADEIA